MIRDMIGDMWYKTALSRQICRGLNLQPFKRSIWLSNRIRRGKTHTLTISWVSVSRSFCISVCPWFYLIFKTDCSGVNIRQNWFIFTARLQTKSLPRNSRDGVSLLFYTSHQHFNSDSNNTCNYVQANSMNFYPFEEQLPFVRWSFQKSHS